MKKSGAAQRANKIPAVSEPVWLKPSPTKRLQIMLPDGSVASDKQAAALGVWPSVRLRIVFDPWYAWRRFRRTPWHSAALATAHELAKLGDWSWIVENINDKTQPPVLHPARYTAQAAKAHLDRTVFFDNDLHIPWTMFRSDNELSVQYSESLVALHESISVHLPPTAANAALLERALDRLVGGVSFAYAGVGFALAGWATSIALEWHMPARRHERHVGPQIDKMEKASRTLGADWLLWVGDRWRESPNNQRAASPLWTAGSRRVDEKGPHCRISVPRPASVDDSKGAKQAKQLAVDLEKVKKKLYAIKVRETLRR